MNSQGAKQSWEGNLKLQRDRRQSMGQSSPSPFGDQDCTGRPHSLYLHSSTHAATPGL